MAIPYIIEDQNQEAARVRVEILMRELEGLLRQMTQETPATLPSVGEVNATSPSSLHVSGDKVDAPNTPTTAIQRQSWEQLGCELRLIADNFSSNRQSTTSCTEDRVHQISSRRGASLSFGHRLLALILPKTINCSAFIVNMGMRYLRQRFS